MTDLFERERTVEITKKIAPWAPEEELGGYLIKRWNWFEAQKAMIVSTVILDKDKGIVQSDLAEYYARMMLSCITPPETIRGWNLERVKALDYHVGEILKNSCRDINGLTWEEKAGFLGRSEAAKGTPG